MTIFKNQLYHQIDVVTDFTVKYFYLPVLVCYNKHFWTDILLQAQKYFQADNIDFRPHGFSISFFWLPNLTLSQECTYPEDHKGVHTVTKLGFQSILQHKVQKNPNKT